MKSVSLRILSLLVTSLLAIFSVHVAVNGDITVFIIFSVITVYRILNFLANL
jgi:hypothetical protein